MCADRPLEPERLSPSGGFGFYDSAQRLVLAQEQLEKEGVQGEPSVLPAKSKSKGQVPPAGVAAQR